MPKRLIFKIHFIIDPGYLFKIHSKVESGRKSRFSGFIRGKMNEEIYPAFDLILNVTDGWFQYPDLPKSVQKIQLASRFTNPGGSLDNAVVDVSDLSFNIGENPFSAQMKVITPMSDPDLRLKAVGKLDLGMIKDIYPLESGTKLNGLLDMNLVWLVKCRITRRICTKNSNLEVI